MKLHRPFLSPWLSEYCSLSRSLNTFPSRCVFSLSVSPFEYPRPRLSLIACLSLAVSLSVISAGQLVRFHKTFSVLRWLAGFFKCQMRTREQWHTQCPSLYRSHTQASTHTLTNINECFLHTHFIAHTYVWWLILIGNAVFYVRVHTHLVLTKTAKHTLTIYTQCSDWLVMASNFYPVDMPHVGLPVMKPVNTSALQQHSQLQQGSWARLLKFSTAEDVNRQSRATAMFCYSLTSF